MGTEEVQIQKKHTNLGMSGFSVVLQTEQPKPTIYSYENTLQYTEACTFNLFCSSVFHVVYTEFMSGCKSANHHVGGV